MVEIMNEERIRKSAREAAAEAADRLGKHGYRARYERGQFDDSNEVRAACIAIMAEREKIAPLVEALKPFALIAELDIGDDEVDSDLFRPLTRHNYAPHITVGHLRAALKALAAFGKEATDAAD